MSSLVMNFKQLLTKEWLCMTEYKKQSRDVQTSMTPQLQIKHVTLDFSKQNVVILKKDEAFGFKIKTDTNDCKRVTCVCSVRQNSPAEKAGITTRDVIVTVNNTCIEGFTHQQIVNLIPKDSCLLKLEIVKCVSVKQKELHHKMRHLQRQLRDKWEELERLIAQEEHLKRGKQNDTVSDLVIGEVSHSSFKSSYSN